MNKLINKQYSRFTTILVNNLHNHLTKSVAYASLTRTNKYGMCSNSKKITINFKQRDGTIKTVQCEKDKHILDIAKANDIEL